MGRISRIPRARRRKARAQAGFSLIEVLVATGFLAFALMAHASTSVSGRQLMRAEGRHGAAIQTLRKFLERMRSDIDWPGLYGRLRARYDAAKDPNTPEYPLTDYYADIEVPAELGDAKVLVRVPRAETPDGTGPLVLREDVSDPVFGLPFDLDGDGQIDADARDEDYRALPLMVLLEWRGRGDAPQRIRVSTWLWGERP